MKVSVSLPDEDVEFLDAYARIHQIASRSATLHRAIRLLRASELAQDYAEAFAEWEEEESHLWDSAVADGLL
ncbi:MAG: ribbon-helix-helix domain-containing protein [bacterium]|nr:ribbon-helix-helix domain-containing protein [bacterium]